MATLVRRLMGGKEAQAAVVHRLGGQTWEVDRGAAGQVMGWVRREAKAWRDDVEGMAAHFPHWVLVGGSRGMAVRCACGGALAPTARALRCVVCGAVGEAEALMWMGQLPLLARPEPSFVERREALRAAGFAETQAGGLVYLLVPLAVTYPAEWPLMEPSVTYAPRWLTTLGLPLGNGRYHVIGGGRACLFGWNQWRPMSVAAVLQQRVVNHAVSLLKVAAGMAPEQAFLGRVAH